MNLHTIVFDSCAKQAILVPTQHSQDSSFTSHSVHKQSSTPSYSVHYIRLQVFLDDSSRPAP